MRKFGHRIYDIITDTTNKLRNGILAEPPDWFKAIYIVPPLYPVKEKKKIVKLTFPMNDLRKKWLKKYPDLDNKPLRNLSRDNRWYKPTSMYYAEKQWNLMQKGFLQKKAFEIVEKEHFEKLEQTQIEIKLATILAQEQNLNIIFPEIPLDSTFFEEKEKIENEKSNQNKKNELQQLILKKKQNNDSTPLNEEELKLFNYEDIFSYLKDFPDDKNYFEKFSGFPFLSNSNNISIDMTNSSSSIKEKTKEFFKKLDEEEKI